MRLQLGVLSVVVAIAGSACASNGTANSTSGEGTISCLIDGKTFSSVGQVVAMHSANGMSATGDNQQASLVTLSVGAHSTGTFPFGGLDAANGRIQMLLETWQASDPGTGQIVITSFSDLSAAGTFEFTATPVDSSGAVGNKVITAGHFFVMF